MGKGSNGQASSARTAPERAVRVVRETPNAKKVFTMEEVRKHADNQGSDDSWIVIDGEVYDTTKWLHKHPGGSQVIKMAAGHDCTPFFRMYHPDYVYDKLKYFHIGTLDSYTRNPIDQAYMDLDVELRKNGYYDTDLTYFGLKLVWFASLFVSSIYFALAHPITGSYLISALCMAMFWQQFAFLGHDLLHNGVTGRKKDYLFSLMAGNSLGGVSSGWWKHSHNIHHCVCNSIHNDPDITHLPIFAVSIMQFGSIFSHYAHKVIPFNAIAKAIIPYQAWIYYPIMGVARFNLYFQTFKFLLRPTAHVEYRKLELFCECIFFVWMYNFLCTFPDWGTIAMWLFVSHFVAGVLHVQITLSHFPMEIYGNDTFSQLDNPHTTDFVRTQLATTVDVDCHPWMDWFHGGLQYQSIHHLFPRIPRHNLRKVRSIVREFCKKHGVKYNSVTFLEGNMLVIQRLNRIAKSVDGDLEIITDAMNLVG